jgi:hypothetical protein
MLKKKEELVHIVGYLRSKAEDIPQGSNPEDYHTKISLLIEEVCDVMGYGKNEQEKIRNEIAKVDIRGYLDKATKRILDKYGKKPDDKPPS